MYNLRLFLFLVALAYTSSLTAQTVYTTKTGKKYHKSSCRYLKYSKKYITLKKAKSLGYQACLVCKPSSKNLKTQRSSPAKKAIAVQCSGKTKSGEK